MCFLEAQQPEFVAYSKQVIANAAILARGMREEGFPGRFRSTDTHLMLVDVFSKGVRGREAEVSLDRARITVNKNAIPFDVNPPLNPSGIRLGSPAATTRGFGEAEMREVASLIAEVLNNVTSDTAIAAVREQCGSVDITLPAVRLEDAGCTGAVWRRRLA